MADLAEELKDISWLYCLAFPVKMAKKSEEESKIERELILDQLNAAQLTTMQFYSSTKQIIFVKVGATEKRLLIEADIQNYELPLDPSSLKLVLESTNDIEKYGRGPIFLDFPYPADVDIPHDFKKFSFDRWVEMDQKEGAHFIRQETSMSAFENIFVRYSIAWDQRILRDHEVQIYKTLKDNTILRPADRIKLCLSAMERADTKDGRHQVAGGGINLERLTLKKIISAGYPLQLGTSRVTTKELTPDQLFSQWNNQGSMPWRQPLDDIRDYAGEKIAMYFAFLGHYTLWLVAPAVIGTGIFIHQIYNLNQATGSFDVIGPGGSAIFVETNNVTNAIISVQTELYTKVPENPFFALFISLWASFLIEFWKRKQAGLALRWGMSNYEKVANNRASFVATHVIPSPVTGEPVDYYSKTLFLTKLFLSATVIFSAVTFVVATIGSILVLKVFMSSTQDIIREDIAPQLALGINGIAILILGQVYKKIAKKLNDWENHRTDIQYEDHLIAKTFVFSFVNSYATLAYIAFVKSGRDILNVTQYCIASAEVIKTARENSQNPLSEDELDLLRRADLCYGSLAYSLFIIFGIQVFVNNTQEVGIPFITARIKAFLDFRNHAKRLAKGVEEGANAVKQGIEDVGDRVGIAKPESMRDDEEEKSDIEINLEDASVRQRMKSPVEYQFYLKQYETPFDDYLELALQFGYVTLFVAAFPIAPLLALLNNVIEVRVDSYKVCLLCRRPDMASAQDIGTWQYIFEIMGFIAVVSNASVILFTADFIDDVEPDTRVWLWIMFIVFVMTIKKVVDFVIDDVPRPIKIQLERTEYITRKVFMLERDDEHVSLAEKKRNSHRFSLSRSIHAVDPFINELLSRAADGLKQAKGESWDMKEIFADADTNRNGVLSIKELKAALLKDPSGLPAFLSSYEINILTSAMDVDGDGTISRMEFKRFLNL